MTGLFAGVYLDEGVSVLLAALLRSRGFEARTTQEEGNLAAPDDRQLEYAAARGLALCTHNRIDFERLAIRYLHEGRHHAGIICASRRHPNDLLRRLLLLLNQHTADEVADNLWYV